VSEIPSGWPRFAALPTVLSRKVRTTFTVVALGLGVVGHSDCASAEPVTLADLQGAVIEESVLYEQVVDKNGQRWTYRLNVDRKISIGPGDKIDDTEVDTRIDASGTHVKQRGTGTWTLGQPREVRGQGGGHKMWTFEDGTLTLLRAFLAGGYLTHISFRRSSSGFTCTVRAPLLHEAGTADLGTRQDKQGREVHMVSARQISSSCRVTRSSSAGA
jgi:hypothetical protein